MKAYELTYIISPEITSEEAEAIARGIEAFVQSKEGVIVKQQNPAARALAYPIKKHASGFVGCIEFQAEPEAIKDIEEKVKKDGKISRSMLIIKKPARMRKERRSRTASATVAPEVKTEPAVQKEEKPKVELKDIEQRLDEILGQ